MVDIFNFFKSGQAMRRIIQGDIDRIIDLLLPVVLLAVSSTQ